MRSKIWARRLAAVVMLLVLSAAIAAASGMGSSGSAHSFPAPRGRSRLGLPRNPPMPDTVLAWVGDHRVISVAGFRRAWLQVKPPARPDSLTPDGARQFLDLLIGKEVLGEQALKESWRWTALESAQYVGLRDRLTLHAVLDSVFWDIQAARAARGDTALPAEAMGIVARDSTVAHLDLILDQPLLERVTRAFTALPRPTASQPMMEQIRLMGTRPSVDAADSVRVLARSSVGEFLVGDLLNSWNHLNPFYRPRVDSSSQVRDLVKNGIYERMLRHEAARRRLVERPDIASQLAERREYLAVSHLVEREVYKKLPMDSLTLLAFYRKHPDDWTIPERVRLIQLVMPDRAAASKMILTLRNQAEAESLAARGERKGASYHNEVSVQTDSVLFTEAMRAGTRTVIGPDSVDAGWRVARVEAVLPPRDRDFTEARPLVEKRWYGEQGERAMQAALTRLRKQTRVVINQWSLDRLIRPEKPARGKSHTP